MTTQLNATLQLNPATWDLMLDASGNIALASAPLSLEQDVASAIRTFLGEGWYDTTVGMPYFQSILGQYPPVALLNKQIVQAALTVPGVVSATSVITTYSNRQISGTCSFVDENGASGNVNY